MFPYVKHLEQKILTPGNTRGFWFCSDYVLGIARDARLIQHPSVHFLCGGLFTPPLLACLDLAASHVCQPGGRCKARRSGLGGWNNLDLNPFRFWHHTEPMSCRRRMKSLGPVLQYLIGMMGRQRVMIREKVSCQKETHWRPLVWLILSTPSPLARRCCGFCRLCKRVFRARGLKSARFKPVQFLAPNRTALLL
jgi:hypothetical protein